MRLNHVLAATALLSTSALADEELKPVQEKARISFEESISSALKAANSACGTRLTVKTNFNKFEPEEWNHVRYDSYCTEVLKGVASMCERPEYKRALAKKVTGVACLFSWNLLPKGAQTGVLFGALNPEHPANKKDRDDDTVPRNIFLWKGVLTYNMHQDDANLADNTRATLEKALRAGSR